MTAEPEPNLARNAALGITQILIWGGSAFFMAVLADPLVADTGWSRSVVVGALSIAILISGLLSRPVGRLIHRHGGRGVLIGGTLLLAVGIVLMSAATSLAMFLAAWVVMGVAMAACLYDPLFSAIGQAYGTRSRPVMTQVALISGFALTLCWPASNWIIQHEGWRVACLFWAALDVFVVVPLFLYGLPGGRGKAKAKPGAIPSGPANRRFPGLLLLGTAFTLAAMIMTAVTVELLTLLQSQGISPGTAVALGALIGPAQVGIRFVEMLTGGRQHPWWNMLASAVFAGTSMILLAVAPFFTASTIIAAAAIIFYGAGNGMRTIVRGTLPLQMYGQHGYADAMGRLAGPALIAQAITPTLCSLVMDHGGAGALLGLMVAMGLANIVLTIAVRRYAMAERPA